MRLLATVLLLTTGASVLAQPSADDCPCPAPDPVVRWNEAVLAAIKADRTPPPVAARNLAIVHGGMYDAVALAGGTYRPFYANLRAPAGADPEAAAAIAAHRALAGLYPGRMDDLDTALDDTLNHIPDGPAKFRGIVLGQVVAEQYLRW